MNIDKYIVERAKKLAFYDKLEKYIDIGALVIAVICVLIIVYRNIVSNI